MGYVSGLNVFIQMGFFASVIGAIDTVPHVSILGHFGMYFTFNIYNTNNIFN